MDSLCVDQGCEKLIEKCFVISQQLWVVISTGQTCPLYSTLWETGVTALSQPVKSFPEGIKQRQQQSPVAFSHFSRGILSYYPLLVYIIYPINNSQMIDSEEILLERLVWGMWASKAEVEVLVSFFTVLIKDDEILGQLPPVSLCSQITSFLILCLLILWDTEK